MKKPEKKKISAKHPTKGKRFRITALRLLKLWHDDPALFARASEMLGTMQKQGRITTRTEYRIMNAPLSYTTLKSKLRQFTQGKISFDQLIESVQKAYSRSVPKSKVDAAITCKQGEFYQKAESLAIAYETPKSFLTELTIRRMKYLKMPKEQVDEAVRIKWGIHQQSHKWHEAQQKGKKQAMQKARKKMLELEHAFNEKFAKRL